MLAGCQRSILSCNEWHNDMNPAFTSPAFLGVPNKSGHNQKWMYHPCLLGGPNSRGHSQKGLHHP